MVHTTTPGSYSNHTYLKNFYIFPKKLGIVCSEIYIFYHRKLINKMEFNNRVNFGEKVAKKTTKKLKKLTSSSLISLEFLEQLCDLCERRRLGVGRYQAQVPGYHSHIVSYFKGTVPCSFPRRGSAFLHVMYTRCSFQSP